MDMTFKELIDKLHYPVKVWVCRADRVGAAECKRAGEWWDELRASGEALSVWYIFPEDNGELVVTVAPEGAGIH